MNGDLNHRLGRAGGLAGCGKMLVLRRKQPQRLKPNSLHMSNVRPKGCTLQRSDFSYRGAMRMVHLHLYDKDPVPDDLYRKRRRDHP
jgi:hypothetical protein